MADTPEDAVPDAEETAGVGSPAGTEESSPSSAEKPKRTRAGAVKADAAGAAAGEAPKARRSRATAGAAEVEETGVEAPADDAAEKPKRSRAAKSPAEAAESAKPARIPTRPGLRRSRRKPETVGAPPLVTAHAKYVRSSARKARLVCDHIRGKSVTEARAILAFAPRGVAKDWAKLLNSAVANAEHNHELLAEDLKIKEVHADVGPTLKRFRPRAMGRATPINKRTSHLSITLTPKG